MIAWLAYFDELGEHALFRLEAEEFVNRLQGVLPVSRASRVLDFGGGFGFVAELLAPAVGELVLWDGSARMRQRAAVRLSGHPRVRVLEAWPPGPEDAGHFDLIVVNSVVQYVGVDELRAWLATWRGLLAPGGRLVLADLPPYGFRTHLDVLDQVLFALRRGVLLKSVRDVVADACRYVLHRSPRGLTRFTADHIAALAAEASLDIEILPRNLTCRRARLSVLCRPVRPETVPS